MLLSLWDMLLSMGVTCLIELNITTWTIIPVHVKYGESVEKELEKLLQINLMPYPSRLLVLKVSGSHHHVLLIYFTVFRWSHSSSIIQACLLIESFNLTILQQPVYPPLLVYY